MGFPEFTWYGPVAMGPCFVGVESFMSMIVQRISYGLLVEVPPRRFLYRKPRLGAGGAARLSFCTWAPNKAHMEPHATCCPRDSGKVLRWA